MTKTYILLDCVNKTFCTTYNCLCGNVTLMKEGLEHSQPLFWQLFSFNWRF